MVHQNVEKKIISSSGLKVSSYRFDSLFIYAMVYLTFLYGPVLGLPLFSFNDSLYVAFPLNGFTLDWYHAMANQTQSASPVRR